MYKHVLVAVAFDAEHDPERSLQAAAVLAPGVDRTWGSSSSLRPVLR